MGRVKVAESYTTWCDFTHDLYTARDNTRESTPALACFCSLDVNVSAGVQTKHRAVKSGACLLQAEAW